MKLGSVILLRYTFFFLHVGHKNRYKQVNCIALRARFLRLNW